MKVLSKYMYGGKSTYKNGGINAPKGFHWMKKGDGKYKIMKHGDKPFKPHEGASLKAKFPVQKKHNPKQDAKMTKRKYEEYSYELSFYNCWNSIFIFSFSKCGDSFEINGRNCWLGVPFSE